ncbi:MAG: metal-dependent hydrolase [Erythrobacter sp.]|jgi:inner membrane protein|uniref:metal-dependent hydrolase n=1 Tax=Erythrobacter sp. TaxID=1042 RepID=UPI002B46AE57|nr:metal-dependent hydrolase [Erythrobacter sp.]WRH71187.1 MAG: metal-dependent hydrolase [Erythrobacter sp.]
MDNLTHSLVGAVLGQAGLKRTTGLAMSALIIGANLPDVDAACFFWLEGTEHLAFRRGITHGPPALVLLPLILAGLLWGWDRWQTRRGTRPEARLPVRFGWLYAMAFIGCLSHPFFDWLNVYGIRLLEPFSSQWFYGDTLFIIDPWLWAVMIAAVWVSRRREKVGAEWMRPARVGIAAVLAYIGVNGWITTRAGQDAEPIAQAHSFAEHGRTVIASPVPLQFWKREMITTYGDGKWSIGSVSVGNCNVWRAMESARGSPQADAFLFWSRAPFAEWAPDGSVILRDARFTDPRVLDRFSVSLPSVKCIPLHQIPGIDLPEPAAP